ncbi:LysR family transcriptional regulator [Rahnella sp. Lac-M11]|jgi:DNA-binding transcriptional LysR family regulator|uniref:LysR family transcriptional regulator n=1 Tax=Rahnella contaminans TaxID=2703882 RepID=A0A6M2B0U4_9GAMM|nr:MULTISPECIES: LysR family transcriptional regulator [Rahnella]KAB8306977.1 LysR family transcriptional regulator [Rouxiella chamberiensis]MBU9821988.1 LysR family transcriptional regulator [Rahnella sp. BCC 1045]MCS3425007.1 DNA-binding transcriptional LysR family regulator [Rahnella sp. BIGb0603]NGX86482.1 LysR family transcriptional regulator [Rahnella contaminans]
MQSTEIRYFLAVANTGSLSAASKQLFVAVSAISRQIQRLEERIGAPLFERHARGMVLNDAGQILENHVRKSMMEMEHAIAEIQGLNAVRRTVIRMACTDGLAFDLLPQLFSRFRKINPGVMFYLNVGTAVEVSEMIHNGEVELALQFSLVAERGVDIMASFPAPVRMVMRPDHPLADKDVLLTDLHPYPLAMNEQGSTIRQLFDLSCRMSGIFLEPAVSCNRFSTLYDFMVQTPGAIVACSHFSIMYKARRDNLRVKPVNIEQLSQRTLQLQSPAGKRRSAALGQFVDFIRDELVRENEAFIRDFDLNTAQL